MSYPIAYPDEGIARQVLTENEQMMLVSVRFEAGAEGALHSHPHVQATYCNSGEFRFVLDGAEHVLRAGDSLMIPSGAEHGCVCVEAGELLDCFTPRRDDFL
ncbi:cupin [Thioclava sediminum]|uniref:Cupin domain-containing protein n=2 Tax=Thioclava TaxID=285107 RepID=A0ABX6YQJ9_9RHOB|nr:MULTISPECIES: cupin domain-containing protein [Thioclava]OOY07050.1 cupin [Thioclava sp. F36-7]OOY25830.1 cupin [Thioclava sediminum]OOY32658.1 cupin [Thioclava sp. F36-6]QPZ90079.1 cupin domain-containing protein [Thioclava electrotropha]